MTLFSKAKKFHLNFTKYFSTLNQNKYSVNIHISFNDFIECADLILFKDIFYKNLNISTKYSYLVKVGRGDIFFTLSERQNFFILDMTHNDEERFNTLNDYLLTNISRILDTYKDVLQEQNFDIITFTFFPIDFNFDDVQTTIKNIDAVKHITSNTNIINIKKQFSMFDNEILNIKGTPLEVDTTNKTFIYIPEDLEFFNFDNIKYLDNSKFFSIKYRGKVYVIVEHIEDDIIIKQCLDKFGISLHVVEERLLCDGGLIRKLGNFHTHYNHNKEVIEIKKDITFNSISSNFKVNNKLSVNDSIGVIDLETFKKDEVSLCYAIGYYTDKESNMFYIDKESKDSNLIIHNCILELLATKYKKYTFYCHNLGGFDAPFIIKALLHYNKNVESTERYTFDIFTRDNSIIRLTIRKRVNGKMKSVTINDSLPILSMSLRALCKAYNVESSKSYFPYKFVNENTLFYKGVTPDKSYYDILNNKDNTEFNSFYEENFSNLWDLKAETLKYLELDLKSLYEVLKIVNLHMFLLFDIQMTENSTISGIAMRTFLDKYYKNTTDKIPLINSNQIYNDIYNAYYGGRVEVFIPKPINNEKLYYYDVNSLYPFASLNDLPGLNWQYIEYTKTPELDNLFGFYYCKVETEGNYFGLLPYRNDKGGLSFPKGKWYGWYFSEELKLAESNGYKIEVIRGYTSDKSKNIFTDFVKNIFKVKLNPKNKAEKNVAKLILNSLIGRFGMNPEKMVTKILNRKEHNIINSTRILKNSITLDNENYLDTFSTSIDKDVCKDFGLDYVKVLNTDKFNFKKGRPISNNTISISTAAAILSYSRIYMAETISNILKEGGRIYYTDTDSIITNIKLPTDITDSKELGKFKLENELVEAYFISDKTYLIKNIKGDIIKKAKSVKEDSLDITDYKRFYNLEVYQSAVKVTSKKDFKAGSVNISSKLVTLNVDRYTKRNRVFENNKWVNSKPVYINNVDKSIVVYNLNTSLIPYNKDFFLYDFRYFIDSKYFLSDNYINSLFNKWIITLYNYLILSIILLKSYNNELHLSIKDNSVVAIKSDDDVISNCPEVINTNLNINKTYNLKLFSFIAHKYYYKINIFVLGIIYILEIYLIKLLLKIYTPTFVLSIYLLINIYNNILLLLDCSYFLENILKVSNDIWCYAEPYYNNTKDVIGIDIDNKWDFSSILYTVYKAIFSDVTTNTSVTPQEVKQIEGKVIPLSEESLPHKSKFYIEYKSEYRDLLLRHFKMLDFSHSISLKMDNEITKYTESSVLGYKDTTSGYLESKYTHLLNKEGKLLWPSYLSLPTYHNDIEEFTHSYPEDSATDKCTVIDILNLEVKPNNSTSTQNNINRILEIDTVKGKLHKDILCQIRTLNDNISNYQNMVCNRDTTIELLVKDSNILKNKILDLNSSLNSKELRVIDLEYKVIEDSHKIEELINEIFSLKSNRTSLSSEVDKYEELLKDNNQIIDDNYKKIYKLDDEISELNSQIKFLNKVKYDYEEVLKSNDDELLSYYNNIKDLKVEVNQFKSKTLTLIEELKMEKSKSEEYLLWYDDTAKQLKDAKDEILKLKQEKI